MSEQITVDLGAVTAYADAVEQGFTGTREEFGELMANFAKRADEVKEDRNAVEQVKDTVFQKVEGFDEHVESEKLRVTEEFNKNAEQVLDTNKQEIGTAKNDALEEIAHSKEDSVTEVTNTKNSGVKEITDLTNTNKTLLENTGTNQKKAITDEGTKQIQAVENKGTATLATIPEDYTALNTSVNDLNDLIHTKAPAIVEEATSGTEITVNDSADGMRLQGMNVYGKSWQKTTTGKNLINVPTFTLTAPDDDKDTSNYRYSIVYSGDELEGGYCFSSNINILVGKINKITVSFVSNDSVIRYDANIVDGKISAIASEKFNAIYVYVGSAGSTRGNSAEFSKIQLEKGLVATPYEPYTGGKPSPSPDYPQEIQSAGYVLSTGAQLLNVKRNFNIMYNNIEISTDNIGRIKIVGTSNGSGGRNNAISDYVSLEKGTYNIFLNIKGEGLILYLTKKDKDNVWIRLYENKNTFEVTEDGDYYLGVNQLESVAYDIEFGIVISKSESVVEYEPYTGGVPALYQKDVEVKLTGKNLFNRDCVYNMSELQQGRDFTNVELNRLKDLKNAKYCAVGGYFKKGKYTFSVHDKTLFLSINRVAVAGTNCISNNIHVRNTYTWTQEIDGNTYLGLERDKSETNYDDIFFGIDDISIMIEKATKATTYQPYKQPQSLPIVTPTGLPAIPVPSDTSGIIYTDADGQAWIADEIDFERGKYIKRVWQAEFDGSEDEVWSCYSIKTGWVLNNGLPENMRAREGFCNEKKIGTVDKDAVQLGSKSTDDNKMFYPNSKYYDTSLSDYGLSNWKAHLAANPLKVMTYLDNPIETDLSEEQIQAYKAVHTNKPTTIITNDADAWMGASYAADTKLYIDNKVQEIASAVIASASEAE